ncbi:hypothetical protein HC891_17660 [Candidatus Gracilibacteria bacterium]|nr:hypothetical protein [Candidatus Gracilibacteria bacterium]
MAIEPGWYGQARAGTGEALAHGKGDINKIGRAVVGGEGKLGDRSSEGVVGVLGKIRAEVGRFHRTGAAAGSDDQARPRQRTRDPRDCNISRFAALHSVAAHNRGDIAIALQQFVERIVDGMIVQALC